MFGQDILRYKHFLFVYLTLNKSLILSNLNARYTYLAGPDMTVEVVDTLLPVVCTPGLAVVLSDIQLAAVVVVVVGIQRAVVVAVVVVGSYWAWSVVGRHQSWY